MVHDGADVEAEGGRDLVDVFTEDSFHDCRLSCVVEAAGTTARG